MHQPHPQNTHAQASVLAAIAVGGAIGACARYGATVVWATSLRGFPWTTFTINVTGCAVMGVLMVLITERRPVHRLVRPFAGTGIIGGYTTFSTYTVDLQRLLTHGEAALALLYLIATVLAALAALWAGTVLARAALTRTGLTRTAPGPGAQHALVRKSQS
jgi:CrcB protein